MHLFSWKSKKQSVVSDHLPKQNIGLGQLSQVKYHMATKTIVFLKSQTGYWPCILQLIQCSIKGPNTLKKDCYFDKEKLVNEEIFANQNLECEAI